MILCSNVTILTIVIGSSIFCMMQFIKFCRPSPGGVSLPAIISITLHVALTFLVRVNDGISLLFSYSIVKRFRHLPSPKTLTPHALGRI